MKFKKGDIVGINPVPCYENERARDNYEYLKRHYKKTNRSTLFTVTYVDGSMVYVSPYDEPDKKLDSMYASRFVLRKHQNPLSDELFEL